jgi:hypothetical protein
MRFTTPGLKFSKMMSALDAKSKAIFKPEGSFKRYAFFISVKYRKAVGLAINLWLKTARRITLI